GRSKARAVGEGRETALRSVKSSSDVVDGAGGVHGGSGSSGSIWRVGDYTSAWIGESSNRTGKVVLDDGRFCHAVGNAGVSGFPADARSDVVAPCFRARRVTHSGAFSDAVV